MPIRCGTLILLFLAGCVSTEPSRTGVSWQTQKADAPSGSDRVLFDIALLQRPIGDPFLSEEIWACADEMIVPPDVRELLELNGYRVGVLVGSPPDKLLNILRSERDCPERRGRSVPAETAVEQKLFEVDREFDADVQIGKKSETVVLERPRFGLDLTPSIKPHDVVHLKIVPRYEAGDKAVNYTPVSAESKWSIELKRPTRSLKELTIAFDLEPNQLLIIGPRLDRERSIGYHSFVGDRDGVPCQRLMALRHVRSKTPAVATDAVDASESVNPPLAIQAATSRR